MAEETGSNGVPWLWSRFRGSGLWRLLKRVSFLRSGYWLAIELGWRESETATFETIEGEFTKTVDPYDYETNVWEQERFALQTAILDEVRGTRLFSCGLEIGCAEGLYTEVLAERCESLLVLDFSPTALERTRRRRAWPEGVRFEAFDLRKEPIPGHFDLIVITGVLEYFSKRKTFVDARKKLSAALRPHGYLLVESTRSPPVAEKALWSKLLIRGKGINSFIAQDPTLSKVSEVMTERFAITLLRKDFAGSAE